MKMRKQKLMSLFLTAVLAVTPIASANFVYAEEINVEDAAVDIEEFTEFAEEDNEEELVEISEEEAEIPEETADDIWSDAETDVFSAGSDEGTEEEPEEIPTESKRTDIKTENISNTTGMFKAVDAYIVEDAGGKSLYITLSGTGYHELFVGTYDEAVATGDDSSKWIIGTLRDDGNGFDGKYQFVIPIAEDTDYMQIQALSDTHKKDGWWWYPRYIRLDQEALTLETGDYRETFDLAVTNNVKMFSVKNADMTIVAGPHSNNYAITSEVTMGSTSYDQAYIGTAPEAEAAQETIALTDDQKFLFTVEDLKGSILGAPAIISFHSVKNDSWYERVFTFDKIARTLVVNDSEKADYTAVDAAKAAIPEDLSIYTEETAAAVTAASNAVKTGLYASQQADVDAMAKAITDAVAALKKKSEDPDPVEKPDPTMTPAPTVTVTPIPTVTEKPVPTVTAAPVPTKAPTATPTPTPKLKMNVASIKLQVKKSTSAVKVSGLMKGEKVTSWKSSKKSVAIVSSKGKITAKKVGTAKITAKTSKGRSVSVTVKVQKKAVTTTKLTVTSGTKGVTIKNKNLTIKKGQKVTLKTALTPITSTSKVTFKSSDKKVATVSSSGKITAKKKGTAKITVTSGKKKVTLTVKVKN